MVANVRRLRSSDLKAILEISRHVWDGHDYLPAVAEQWLHSPRSRFYGVEVDGHVVAVGNLEFIEDGSTGWMEGLRVHPDYRGKGLANNLTQHIVQEAEQFGVKRLRYTTSARNAASLKLAKMAGFSKILTMSVFWHMSPKMIVASTNCSKIRKRNKETVWKLLNTNSSIVLSGILIYDWKALDNTCRNIEEIGKTHAFYIAVTKGKVDSLSFGHVRQEPDRTWSFTIYASDSDGFLCQLSRNQATALRKGFSSIACTYETRFEKVLNELDLGSEEYHGTRLVLLEKKMIS
jgi:N-acetylglutamate synthase-like GNAT family acetyltransferase